MTTLYRSVLVVLLLGSAILPQVASGQIVYARAPSSDSNVAHLVWNSTSTTPICDNCPPSAQRQMNGVVCSNDSYKWGAETLHEFVDPIPPGHKLLRVRFRIQRPQGLELSVRVFGVSNKIFSLLFSPEAF